MLLVHKKKAMFLHGLESIVPSQKTEWLNQNFDVLAPQIDYRKDGVFSSPAI